MACDLLSAGSDKRLTRGAISNTNAGAPKIEATVAKRTAASPISGTLRPSLGRIWLRVFAQRKMVFVFKYTYYYDTIVRKIAHLCRALRTISRSSPQRERATPNAASSPFWKSTARAGTKLAELNDLPLTAEVWNELPVPFRS
jgi:hypothetical protein